MCVPGELELQYLLFDDKKVALCSWERLKK